MLPDMPYPDDVAGWETYRAELRAIIQSDKLETIPDKPFE
jgi:hypothetical protein